MRPYATATTLGDARRKSRDVGNGHHGRRLRGGDVRAGGPLPTLGPQALMVSTRHTCRMLVVTSVSLLVVAVPRVSESLAANFPGSWPNSILAPYDMPGDAVAPGIVPRERNQAVRVDGGRRVGQRRRRQRVAI